VRSLRRVIASSTLTSGYSPAGVAAARVPDAQVIADYTSAELRAISEARAYAVGAFTRYLLTGLVQTAEDIVRPLSHGYLLTRDELDTARALVLTDVVTMTQGQVPPHELCHEVLGFLQREFPDAIVPSKFQVA